MSKIAIYVVGAVVAMGVLTGIYRGIYNKGWHAGQDALQASVEKRNQEAARHAKEARNEMDKCYDAGHSWDQSRGVCITK